MAETGKALWIWFQLLFGIGSRRSELMLHYFGHPGDLLASLESGGKARSLMSVEEKKRSMVCRDKAETLLARTLRKGCAVITPDDGDYPECLQGIYAKPAALYVKGDLSCLRDSLAIAMVGSRKCSDSGKRAATKLAGELAAEGVVVISGMAHGIDAACHNGALEAGGKTIGVLACGIDVDYPKGSSPRKRGASQNGAVLTEYPLGAEPKPFHFPVRNRLLSGMSRGVVVVEAGARSGALLTVRHALEQGRDVFAVPGDIQSPGYEGIHVLLRDGAKPVMSAVDILEEYHARKKRSQPAHNSIEKSTTIIDPPQPPAPPRPPRELPAGLSSGGGQVYGLLEGESVTVEELGENADLTTAALLTALTELELYGLIESLPGRRFRRT